MDRLSQLIRQIEYRTQWKKYPMTISDTHRYVWFRNAKCGTTTIRKLLESVEDGLVTPSGARFAKFDPARYQGYFKFAFVRNPYDRLVSCYFNKVQGHNQNRLHLRGWSPGLSFAGFVDSVCRTPDERSNRHYRSQTTLMDLGSLDLLGRLENFDHDLRAVMQRIVGKREIAVTNRNATERAPYWEYYDEDSVERVARRYSEDLRLLGYDFDGPVTPGEGAKRS